MAKVFVINGVRCVPEVTRLSDKAVATVIENARQSAIERADLSRTILTTKANEILKSL